MMWHSLVLSLRAHTHTHSYIYTADTAHYSFEPRHFFFFYSLWFIKEGYCEEAAQKEAIQKKSDPI